MAYRPSQESTENKKEDEEGLTRKFRTRQKHQPNTFKPPALHEFQNAADTLTPCRLGCRNKLFEAYTREAPETCTKGILTERTIRLCLARESEVTKRTRTLRDKTTRRIEQALKTAISIGITEEILDRLQQADQAIVKAKQLDDEHEFEKARSRAEAVFHQLLEICSDTAGLFKLNGKVPEPQWQDSNMEVDLLCTSHRIAVELDGYHHFNSKARYKLDRRKDFLLQRQAFFVIRLHAEDLLSDLPENLDMIRTAVRIQRNEMYPSKREHQ